MKPIRIALFGLALAGACIIADAAQAEMGYLRPLRRASTYNWHGNYAYTPYGRPTALVVPPTAQLQTNWSWGAPASRVSRIDHQFTRNHAGAGAAAARPTPLWPTDTTMFGVYYVRGPWYPTQP
ncbi:MAG: hypothetical protein CMJ58_26290 [Planctomycetaceae bacterium]|nr:hypothetical protein [Planctomycetaceae bacterium]